MTFLPNKSYPIPKTTMYQNFNQSAVNKGNINIKKSVSWEGIFLINLMSSALVLGLFYFILVELNSKNTVLENHKNDFFNEKSTKKVQGFPEFFGNLETFHERKFTLPKIFLKSFLLIAEK